MRRRQQGMTLLEVMVALAILALAGTGLLRAAIDAGLNVRHLEKRQLAQWAATEAIVRQRLAERAPPTSGQRQLIDMGIYRFVVTRQVATTTSQGIYRVDLEVRDEATAGQAIYTMRYFVGE